MKHTIFRLALLLTLLLCACQREAQVSAESLEEMLQRGQASQALEAVRTALDRDPTRSELQLVYAKMLIGRRDFHLALWPLREAARDPLYTTRAQLLLAQTQLAIRNSEEALAALGEVLEREPDNRDALTLRANAYLEAMSLEEALEDTQRLLEQEPDDVDIRLTRLRALLYLERVVEAEEALSELRTKLTESPDDFLPEMHARVCTAEAVFLREKKNLEGWYDTAISCGDEFPSQHIALQEALQAHVSRGERDAATARIEKALEVAPEDGQIRFLLAEQHRKLGDPEAGERVLREGIEQFEPPRSQDWRALYEYFWQLKDFPGALVALERAIELIPSPSTADLLLLSDTLIEANELERAEAVAERLGEGYRDLVWGRIRLERGDLEGARRALLSGIRVWPNNPVARLLLARVAARSGDLEEALSQYIEAYRIDQSHNAGGAEKTDAAKEIARIELALGAYEQAAEFAINHVGAKRSDLEGYELLARAGARGGEPKFVTSGLSSLSALPTGHSRAVALQAELISQAEGPAAAIEAIRRWKPDLRDPANARVLDALLEQLALLERHDEALEAASRSVAAAPQDATFQALRARALARGGRDRESVRAALDEALRLDPDEATALLLLADLEGSAGNVDAALAAYDRAALADAASAQAGLAAGRLLASEKGRRNEALLRLEQVLVEHPLESRAATLLAELALQADERPDLDRALSWASRAAQFAGALSLRDASQAYGVLGRVHAARGEKKQARSSLDFALELDRGNAEANAALEQLGGAEGERG